MLARVLEVENAGEEEHLGLGREVFKRRGFSEPEADKEQFLELVGEAFTGRGFPI